jgi:serine/threonine protein kinase
MNLTEKYILSDQVELLPAHELPLTLQEKLAYEESDFVISQKNSRSTSKVIDAGMAELVHEFDQPKSWVEAVFKYALLKRLDPVQTMEDAFSFFTQLRSEGFLVSLEQPQTKKLSLDQGDFFLEYEIVAKMQDLSDSQVYRVTDETGISFALKIFSTKSGQDAPVVVTNEIRILQQLDGSINPALVKHGSHEGHAYLILEWFDGENCQRIAERNRNFPKGEKSAEQIALVAAILDAYDRLHRQHILHGDIHPGNILVKDDGSVKIIDFGLSGVIDERENVPRGGISFFFEPEYAAAMREKKTPPPSTMAGEQYNLAALSYLLLSGQHHYETSIEKETLYDRISQAVPPPFSTYNIAVPNGIETAIFRALSIKPEDRFDSVGEFATAVKKAVPSQFTGNIMLSENSFEAFRERIIRKYDLDSPLIENGLSTAPTCSVNFGAAGIAYMFFRMALLKEDPTFMALAEVWANRAGDYMQQGDNAFYASDMEITKESVGTSSIYHSASGVHLVQSMINRNFSQATLLARSATNFITIAGQDCHKSDLTLGTASTLLGCALLYEEMKNRFSDLEILRSLAERRLNELAAICMENVMAGNESNYFGMAHGWAGVIYAAAKWCHVTGTHLPGPILEKIIWLQDKVIIDNKVARWPIMDGEPSSWTGWCHGSAGYVFLWTMLYKLTGEMKYMALAEQVARHFIPANHNVAQLCCGTAGEAYALLNLYNTTQDIKYLQWAKQKSAWALKNWSNPSHKANSLYKGEIGIAILFAELENPAAARMPLFE